MVDSASETTTDVEAAHAMAPGASILLVETPVAETLTGGGFPQLVAAENYVVTHDLGDVISQSFGIPEQNFPGRAAILRLRYAYLDADRHHVTVLAAANDFGVTGPARSGGLFRTQPVVDWPASDPLVTGVGGTRLRLTAGGSRLSPDSAWNESGNPVVARYAGASSGGASAIFTRPAYQDPVRTVVGNRRGVPDVALGLHTRLGLVNPLLYRLEQDARRGSCTSPRAATPSASGRTARQSRSPATRPGPDTTSSPGSPPLMPPGSSVLCGPCCPRPRAHSTLATHAAPPASRRQDVRRSARRRILTCSAASRRQADRWRPA